MPRVTGDRAARSPSVRPQASCAPDVSTLGPALAASGLMRKILVVTTLLLLAACQQETQTNATVSDTGTTQPSPTPVTATMPQSDTAATAEATRDAAEAARDAAHKTGTALEEAGKKIQEKTDTSNTTKTDTH